MTRALLVLAGLLVTLVLYIIDQDLTAEIEGPARIERSRPITLSADPSLKSISEHSGFMRSER